MDMTTMLANVKAAMRITVTAYDAEITSLINAAVLDLGIAGITVPDAIDALVTRAIITYCRCNFGSPDDYDRLKAAYDEQKAQLQMSSLYHVWGS